MKKKKPKCFGQPAICSECNSCGKRIACFGEFNTEELQWFVLVRPAELSLKPDDTDRPATGDWLTDFGLVALFPSLNALGLRPRRSATDELKWYVGKKAVLKVIRADERRVVVEFLVKSAMAEALAPSLSGKKRRLKVKPDEVEEKLVPPLYAALEELKLLD